MSETVESYVITRERVIALAESRGEFVQEVDGFVYWWPSKESQGYLAAHHLRWLAEELDRRNKDREQQINEFFESRQ